MKILYSCLSESWGGMEMFTLTAVKQLLKRNIKVELLCYPHSRINIEANNLDLIIHTVKASGYFHPIQVLRLAQLIKINKYNLIHTQASKDLWVLVPALNLLRSRIPLLMTKQVGSFIVKKDFLHRYIYKRLNLALAISEVIKKNLVETCPLDENKIKLLHNAVDTKKFSPEFGERNKVRNEFGIKDDELLFGMMARFSPGKGHEEFISAANKIAEQFTNVKFLIVGEASRGEEVYAEKIKQTASENKRIIFSGFRSDTVNVLTSLDVFVFPSHAEAFGIALVEAMSMRLPTICSNSDGVLDIAIDNETSLLFQKQNAEMLHAKMVQLIEDAGLRKKLGEAGRKRAVEKFDLQYLTDKAVEIYKEVLAT